MDYLIDSDIGGAQFAELVPNIEHLFIELLDYALCSCSVLHDLEVPSRLLMCLFIYHGLHSVLKLFLEFHELLVAELEDSDPLLCHIDELDGRAELIFKLAYALVSQAELRDKLSGMHFHIAMSILIIRGHRACSRRVVVDSVERAVEYLVDLSVLI